LIFDINALDRLKQMCIITAMSMKYNLKDMIATLQDRVKEVEEILDMELHETMASKWMTKTTKTLAEILGQDDQYVKDFKAIDLNTSFIVETLSPNVEVKDNRLALEDARVFLVSLMDELESEYRSAPGIMDMESIFAEINRYISNHGCNSSIRDDLHQRIARLKEGLLKGNITGEEIKRHIRRVGDLDTELFERLIPLLAWFYIDRNGVSRVYNS